MYGNVPLIITRVDVLVYTIVVGSVIGVAYYGVSMAIASITTHSQKIAQAVYPKLLAKGSRTHIQENFHLVLYFALPLLGTAIIFSKPALFALNPMYQDGHVVVVVMSLQLFFLILNSAFRQALAGTDEVDVEKNITFAKLAKSKLFFVANMWSLQSVVYIAVLVAVLYILQPYTSEVDLVASWVLVLLCIEFAFFMCFLIVVKRNIEFRISFRPILKYIGATLGFVLLYYVTADHIITYHENIFDFLPGLFMQFLLCMAAYLGITYAVDMKTRRLFKSAIMEIFQK